MSLSSTAAMPDNQDNSWQSLLNMSPPAGNYVDPSSLTFDDLLNNDYNDPLNDLSNHTQIKQEQQSSPWENNLSSLAEDPSAPYEITMPPRRTQTMPMQTHAQQQRQTPHQHLQQQQIQQIQAARQQCIPANCAPLQQARQSFDGNAALFTSPLSCQLSCADKVKPNGSSQQQQQQQQRPSIRRAANSQSSTTTTASEIKGENSVSPQAIQRTPASISTVSKTSPSGSLSAEEDNSPAASTASKSTKGKPSTAACAGADAEMDSKDRRKSAHSRIERRYRAKMNAKFQALKDAIPNLQGNKAPWPTDCDDMDIEDLAANAKPNKTTILTQAAGYIQQMEKQTQQMNREIEFLQSRVKALEKLASCEDCWLLASMGNLSFNPAVAAQSGA